MKSIVVPKNSIPPATETLVLQITKREAEELLDISLSLYQITGSRNYCSASFERHLKEYLARFKEVNETI